MSNYRVEKFEEKQKNFKGEEITVERFRAMKDGSILIISDWEIVCERVINRDMNK